MRRRSKAYSEAVAGLCMVVGFLLALFVVCWAVVNAILQGAP